MMSTRSPAPERSRAAARRIRRGDPRTRRLALASAALLCVFVIAAGTIVAVLLPRRLARFDVAAVRDRPAAGAPAAFLPGIGPGTGGAGTTGAGTAAATPAGVARAI